MNELPKELTPELLSLVLDEKVVEVNLIQNNNLYFKHHIELNWSHQNLDTLTRLMKEWVLSKGYGLEVIIDTDGYMARVTMLGMVGNGNIRTAFQRKSEFEAVLKDTEWVAKEEGLLL